MGTYGQAILIAVGLTLIVVLFMGPGMWSSTTDPLVVSLWRKLRKRFNRPSAP